ncbi:nucleoid-associated protein [Halobaculum sp. MBLA0147]|uniref:hypothetical protein n=1 Tax=Halobaculum sp. MBLA0147 TaxID=3079934 RepID=UPI003523DDEB
MSTQTGVRFDVTKVAQVDVGGRSNQRIKSETKAEYGNLIPDIFDEYINRIATMRDKSDVFVGDFIQASSMRQSLAKVSNPSLGIQDFEDVAANLAVSLNNKMSQGNAASGTLFVSQVEFDGQNIQSPTPVNACVLLKMGTEVIERLARDNGDLDDITQDEVYPDASNIQKAAISPLFKTQTFRRSGEIKIYDKTDSDYFKDFLQCNRSESSLSQFNKLSEIVSDLRTQSGNGLVRESDIDAFENKAANNSDILNRPDMVDVIRSATGNGISRSDIESELESKGVREIDVANSTSPSKFKYEIDVGGESISVYSPVSLDSNITVQSIQGGGIKLEIDGDSVSKETKGR